MAALLKYKMKCSSEDCGKRTIILVDPDEIDAPNICPFCGADSKEVTGDEPTE